MSGDGYWAATLAAYAAEERLQSIDEELRDATIDGWMYWALQPYEIDDENGSDS